MKTPTIIQSTVLIFFLHFLLHAVLQGCRYLRPNQQLKRYKLKPIKILISLKQTNGWLKVLMMQKVSPSLRIKKPVLLKVNTL